MQSSNEFEAARILREGRTATGLEIEAISQLTRIPQEQIRALEEGRYGDLPGSAYARAFARTLSNTYNLDPDMVVAALRRDMHDPVEASVAPEPISSHARMQSSTVSDEPTKEKSGGFVLLAVLALALLALIGLTRLKNFSPTPSAPGLSAADSAALDTAAAPVQDTVATPPAPTVLPRTLSIASRDTGHSVFLLYIKAGRVRKSTLEGVDSLVLDPDTTALFRNLSTYTLRIGGAISRDSIAEKYFRIDRRNDSVRILPANEDEWKTLYDKIMERRKDRSHRDSN